MVATLAGLGALLFGLALLLLPLLATELSRPGDSAWGALVLVLALVLVTSAERLTGAPMLAVVCGGLLIGRLSVEVGRGRWRQLSIEEQGRLGTMERWRTSVHQAGTSLQELLETAGQTTTTVLERWRERRQPKASGKRWVRPDTAADAPSPPSEPPAAAPTGTEVVEVSDFNDIDRLLQAAPADSPTPGSPPADGPATDGPT
ncbi:MAG: Ycf66 family protein [Cyanobacteriota bacterium]|jgi:hypothetical protein